MTHLLASLSDSQRAQLTPHARRWMDLTHSTQPAVHAQGESAGRRCYELAGLPWHGNVVWASSPLVLSLAAPLAVLLLQWRIQGLVYDATDATVEDLIDLMLDTPSGALAREVCRTARAVVAALPEAPQIPVPFVDTDTREALARGIAEPVTQALDQAVAEAVRLQVKAALRVGMSSTINDLIIATVDNALIESLRNIDWRPHGATRDWWGRRGILGILERSPTLRSRLLPRDWAAASAYYREVGEVGLPGDLWERAQALEQLTQASVLWYPHRDFLMLCERPVELHWETGRGNEGEPASQLHHLKGPAAAWSDGWALYAAHGRRVPSWIITQPERVTVESIEQERNAEVRRMMLECFGWSRYINECGAEVVDSIPMNYPVAGLRGARLLRKDLPGEPEPLVYLDMINSTPEADGTYRHYLERIDPKAYNGDAGRKCHAAMASRWHHRTHEGKLERTFARWQDYRPTQES